MDEDDNLMADALENYRGLDSGIDDDAQPRGRGVAGDGLTAFEEYRGFLVSSGDCLNGSVDDHVRTSPRVKDLFVHTPDPELEMTLPHFAWSSGLEVHPICERQYSGNPEIDWQDWGKKERRSGHPQCRSETHRQLHVAVCATAAVGRPHRHAGDAATRDLSR